MRAHMLSARGNKDTFLHGKIVCTYVRMYVRTYAYACTYPSFFSKT